MAVAIGKHRACKIWGSMQWVLMTQTSNERICTILFTVRKPFSVLDQYKALVRHFSTAGNPPPFIYTQPMTDQLKVLCGPHLASQSIAAAASAPRLRQFDGRGVYGHHAGDSETIESGKSKRRKADGDAMETTPVKADLASEADPRAGRYRVQQHAHPNDPRGGGKEDTENNFQYPPVLMKTIQNRSRAFRSMPGFFTTENPRSRV